MTARACGYGRLSLAHSLLMRLAIASVAAIGTAASLQLYASQTAASEAQPNRVRAEYFPPKNPAHQPIYDMLTKERALERLQDVFSPFQLPIEIKLRIGPCDGVANAWYNRPAISVCYEYLDEIMKTLPSENAPKGMTRSDAMIGQFFYVFAHEFGHASFDVFGLPVLGNEEDAADQFATYVMLQFGKDDARRLITGASFAYERYVRNPEVSAPLVAFSDSHAAPAQRYFNMLCLAYGADEVLFADLVARGYLPNTRARNCKREYNQVAFAFRNLITPHLDQQLERKVLDKEWLPEVAAHAAPR
jgi:Putative metallopeptidase